MPTAPGALWSGTHSWPRDSAASAKRSMSGYQVSRGWRAMGMGPWSPWYGLSPKSVSVSMNRNHGSMVAQSSPGANAAQSS